MIIAGSSGSAKNRVNINKRWFRSEGVADAEAEIHGWGGECVFILEWIAGVVPGWESATPCSFFTGNQHSVFMIDITDAQVVVNEEMVDVQLQSKPTGDPDDIDFVYLFAVVEVVFGDFVVPDVKFGRVHMQVFIVPFDREITQYIGFFRFRAVEVEVHLGHGIKPGVKLIGSIIVGCCYEKPGVVPAAGILVSSSKPYPKESIPVLIIQSGLVEKNHSDRAYGDEIARIRKSPDGFRFLRKNHYW